MGKVGDRCGLGAKEDRERRGGENREIFEECKGRVAPKP